LVQVASACITPKTSVDACATPKRGVPAKTSPAKTAAKNATKKGFFIGILKAIGAKKIDVLLLFITEAGIMSLIGGFIGLLFGMGLAQLIIIVLPNLFMMPENAAAGLKLVVNPLLLIGALMISLGIGIVSGYLPAKKAAELNPIEAIWYE